MHHPVALADMDSEIRAIYIPAEIFAHSDSTVTIKIHHYAAMIYPSFLQPQ